MASALIKQPCKRCGKGGGIATCGGCLEWFCTKHLLEHRQELAIQIDQIGHNHDLLQRDLIQENVKHSLVGRIDDWEQQSIKKIQVAAEEARKQLQQYLDQHIAQLKVSLCQMSTDLAASHDDDDYTEINLNKWNEQLKDIRGSLEKPETIDIIDDDLTIPTIRVIQLNGRQTTFEASASFQEVRTMTKLIRSVVKISIDDRWVQHGVTVAGGYGPGNQDSQLRGPRNLYVDYKKTLHIADRDNHRVVEWKQGATNAQVVAGGSERGNQTDRLDHPTDVVIDRRTDSLMICDRNNRRVMRWSRQSRGEGEVILSNMSCQGLAMNDEGFLYVSDPEKHEVRRYGRGETVGTVVAGGHGKGDHLNQLNFPGNVFVGLDDSVYVSDYNNHRVIRWMKDAKEGIIVAGGHGGGDKRTQLSHPRGVVVDTQGTVYVVDGHNNRIMRWCKGATQGEVIVGGNDKGERANQLNYPKGLTFDESGNLYVADASNHRIQRFDIQNSQG